MYSPQHIVKNIYSSPLSLRNAPEPGLINDTYIVGTPPQFVLQWVNPIFSPLIHDDLDVITKHLQSKGLTTPTLHQLPNGDLCYPDEDNGYWRMWTFIPGNTFHTMDSIKKAFSSGVGVGKFHQALSDLNHDFKAPPRGGLGAFRGARVQAGGERPSPSARKQHARNRADVARVGDL